ncbi:plasmid mobilization relaxosome protein MobC [Chitinophaga sancti]|uniref:plasmid mobilization protein n=1 Tax=Chitinophaga sancti TaxID=1004 RepID=UPI002A765AB3|nr:plasmid mobilization relaxosome protein MobC [Chitinophaga sancti]WPQ61893.1 plasmid mobilization relaxosome protein MobC [Chitinophaga sancti]
MNSKNKNRVRLLGVLLSPEEFKSFEQNWQSSGCKKMSEFARRKLFDKPIVSSFRNKSLDDFMGEMIHLRKELNALAINYNQALKKLNSQERIPSEKSWFLRLEMEHKILLSKVNEIKSKINSIADQWLQ